MWTHRRSGQTNQRGEQDHRNPYERDKTRAIHCPSFRRLQRKTQILRTDEGDFHRTRLTHSLEVASIGCSIVRNLAISETDSLPDLLPHDDLISVICLLHDIGHPPFGHGGEAALNYMMRAHGGFEGNGQTLRLLTKVENSYGNFGLDLTRRALLGLLKYPLAYSQVIAEELPSSDTPRINDWLPPKAYFDTEQAEVDWLLSSFSLEDRTLFQEPAFAPQGRRHGKAKYQSFDCSVMNIADDIAYGVHDLEDAIHLNLISREQLDTEIFRTLLAQTPLALKLVDALFSSELSDRKQAIGEMVNYFITANTYTVTSPTFENMLLRYNLSLRQEARDLLDYLTSCIYTHVIDSEEARIKEFGGQTVIQRLFQALYSCPDLLDKKNRLLFQTADNESAAMRVIADYIANMTDEHAYRLHERLLGFV